MSVVADLLVKISADSSGLRKELQATQRNIKNAFGSEAIAQSQKTLNHLGWLATGFMAAGAGAVKMAADMEQTTTAFETLLGSAAAAKSMVKDLSDFAARTPFELNGISKSTQMLLAYGFAAQDVIPMLTAVGDAVSGLGGNPENMQSVIRALGQMQAKGKVSAEEMMQLSEQGINAWKYLADAMGVTIAKAQDLAKKGAISSADAIKTIVNGMNTQFAGGMDKQSQTMNGMLSTMKDNIAASGRVIGNTLADAFDLKDVLKDTNKFLTEFASLAEKSGIGNAMKELIPDSVKVSLLAVSSLLTVRLVPALAMATPKILAFKAALMGWPGIIGAAVFALGFLASELTGTTHVMSNATKDLVKSFEGVQVGGTSRQRGAAKTNIRARGTKQGGTKTTVPGSSSVNEATANYYKENAALKEQNQIAADLAKNKQKLSRITLDTSDADTKASKKAATALKKLQEEAKDTSKRISDQWVEMTGTKMDVLDQWYADELSELNKSKGANKNYQRDLNRLEETYSEKRRQIIHEEAQEKQKTFEEIKNGYTSIVQALQQNSLKGSASDLFSMTEAARNDYKGVVDYFDQIGAEYEAGTKKQKDNIITALNEMGIAYKVTAKDSLDFSLEKEEYKLAREKQLMDERVEYLAQCKDIEANIQEAYNQMSISKLQETLTEESVLRLNHMDAMQEMMNTYEEARLASLMTTEQLMANMYSAGFSGISNSISDIITGTATLEDAFKSLGKSILKVLADWIAQKIAGIVTTAAMSKTTLATETAASLASAAAVAAAWAPAAAAVSLASFGANSGPAMAGISATHALSRALSVPQLAEGGITTGPTLAQIGEGRYREVVLPLSDKVFSKLASGIKQEGGQTSGATVNIYGDINGASDEERIFGKLFNDTRFALMGA